MYICLKDFKNSKAQNILIILSLDDFRPVYEIGKEQGIVLFVNSREPITISTICAQVKMYDHTVEYLELSKALIFNPFNPISAVDLEVFIYRSFLYRKLPDEKIFEMFEKIGIVDDEE